MDPKVELNYLFIARTQGLLKLKESRKKDLKLFNQFSKEGEGAQWDICFQFCASIEFQLLLISKLSN